MIGRVTARQAHRQYIQLTDNETIIHNNCSIHFYYFIYESLFVDLHSSQMSFGSRRKKFLQRQKICNWSKALSWLGAQKGVHSSSENIQWGTGMQDWFICCQYLWTFYQCLNVCFSLLIMVLASYKFKEGAKTQYPPH